MVNGSKVQPTVPLIFLSNFSRFSFLLSHSFFLCFSLMFLSISLVSSCILLDGMLVFNIRFQGPYANIILPAVHASVNTHARGALEDESTTPADTRSKVSSNDRVWSRW